MEKTTSSPPTCVPATRSRLPWQTHTYNDNRLLQEILRLFPTVGWAQIYELFNGTVPASRQRSMDSIVCKGKFLQRQHRLASSTNQQVNVQPAVAPDTIALDTAHEYWVSLEPPSELRLALMRGVQVPSFIEPVDWDLDMIITSWDWQMQREHQAAIVDSVDGYTAMCQKAMDSAAGLLNPRKFWVNISVMNLTPLPAGLVQSPKQSQASKLAMFKIRNGIALSSDVAKSCGECSGRWRFISESYHRERQLVDEVLKLNHHVAASTAALQHAGMSTQRDRIALNSTSTQLANMQRSYSELQIMLAKAENKSQEEGQELRLLQERFNQNQLHITALENDMDWVWKAHARMGEIISQCSTPEGGAAPSVDVGKIMLDLEAKSIRIQALEDESKLIKSERSKSYKNWSKREQVITQTRSNNRLESYIFKG
ncbi:MAG: hypothetical protein Q9190_005646 [Brigantiaea leucoxantha]